MFAQGILFLCLHHLGDLSYLFGLLPAADNFVVDRRRRRRRWRRVVHRLLLLLLHDVRLVLPSLAVDDVNGVALALLQLDLHLEGLLLLVRDGLVVRVPRRGAVAHKVRAVGVGVGHGFFFY